MKSFSHDRSLKDEQPDNAASAVNGFTALVPDPVEMWHVRALAMVLERARKSTIDFGDLSTDEAFEAMSIRGSCRDDAVAAVACLAWTVDAAFRDTQYQTGTTLKLLNGKKRGIKILSIKRRAKVNPTGIEPLTRVFVQDCIVEYNLKQRNRSRR